MALWKKERERQRKKEREKGEKGREEKGEEFIIRRLNVLSERDKRYPNTLVP